MYYDRSNSSKRIILNRQKVEQNTEVVTTTYPRPVQSESLRRNVLYITEMTELFGVFLASRKVQGSVPLRTPCEVAGKKSIDFLINLSAYFPLEIYLYGKLAVIIIIRMDCYWQRVDGGIRGHSPKQPLIPSKFILQIHY